MKPETRLRRPRGRPCKDAPPPAVETRWRVEVSIDPPLEARLQAEREKQAPFILLTNVPREALSAADVLREYKQQVSVERRFPFLKDPVTVDGICLKRADRAYALAYVFLFAILIAALLERRVRYTLRERGDTLTLEGRRVTDQPTLRGILELFWSLQIVVVDTGQEVVRLLPDNTNPQALKVLRLLVYCEAIYIQTKGAEDESHQPPFRSAAALPPVSPRRLPALDQLPPPRWQLVPLRRMKSWTRRAWTAKYRTSSIASPAEGGGQPAVGAWFGDHPGAWEALDEADERIALSLLRQYRVLREEVEGGSTHRRVAARIRREPLACLLLILPGVSLLTAAHPYAWLGHPARFSGPRRVTRYAGLDPSVHESGETKRRGQISQHGCQPLRTALIEAALSVARQDAGPLRQFFRRLRKRMGYPKAIAAQLLIVAWRMMLTETPYRGERPETTARKVRALERKGVIRREASALRHELLETEAPAKALVPTATGKGAGQKRTSVAA